jgi:hypothetical protein
VRVIGDTAVPCMELTEARNVSRWNVALSLKSRTPQSEKTAMSSDNQARLRVAALIYLIVNAVVFGVGLISVLMTPTLAQHAFFWIPAIIVTSFVLSAPLAWFIAPSMMMHFIQAHRVH